MEYIGQPFKECVTPQQYANAKMHWEKLIAGNISGQFDMSVFTDNGDGQEYFEEQGKAVCGTAGCSAGYLPETLEIPLLILSEYVCEKYLIIQYTGLVENYLGIPVKGELCAAFWLWCFDSHWSETDNTAKGAGIRMRILYEQGLPVDWWEQIYAHHPLMYQGELNQK